MENLVGKTGNRTHDLRISALLDPLLLYRIPSELSQKVDVSFSSLIDWPLSEACMHPSQGYKQIVGQKLIYLLITY